MRAPSPIKQALTEIGTAICAELVRLLNERGHYPLRTNSALAKHLLSGEAVQVNQQRDSQGHFAGYGNSSLTIVALDYLQWLDTGRAPGGKKIPISALLAFIKGRGLGQIRGKGGRYGKRTISANALAWAIQAAVFKNGLKGRHVLAPAWALGQQLLDDYLNTSLLDSMTLELEQQFKFA
jgi:hypothetical protein